MLTEMRHGDVIAGMSFYDELDHELMDAQLAPYRPARKCDAPDGDFDCMWSADDGDEFAGHHLQRLRDVAERPDEDIYRDVLRALTVDGIVPLTVDARVCAGVVTLTGTIAAERERDDAKYLAGLVPGVFGVIDKLSCWPGQGHVGSDSAEACTTRELVLAAFRRTGITDLAEVTIDEQRPGALVISGALHSRDDHNLAIATAWSVADVEAVDDCIEVES